ncbi:MAG: BA14K family protein [Pseudomonadota bacterium]
MFYSAQMSKITRFVAACSLASLTATGIVAPFSAALAGDGFNPGIAAPVKPMVPGGPGDLAPGVGAGGNGGNGGNNPPSGGTPTAGGSKPDKFGGELIAAGIIGMAAGAILSGTIAKPAATTQLPPWWIAECARRYKTYNPDDNTFLAKNGYRYPCDPR